MKKIYLIATIVAILTGFATYLFANEIQKSLKFADAEKVGVVIAAQDIPENTIIKKEMLTIIDLPREAITSGAETNTQLLLGRMTDSKIFQGEQILSKKVIEVGKDSSSGQLSYQLKSGEYVVTIPVDTQKSASNFIKENDFVDILETINGETKYLFEKIRVIKIGNNQQNVDTKIAGIAINTYSEVTIVVTKQQAFDVTDALGKAKLTLILSAYIDNVSTTTAVASK